MAIESVSVDALVACVFRRFSMTSSAGTFCGTSRHCITVSPFDQVHSSGYPSGTTSGRKISVLTAYLDAMYGQKARAGANVMVVIGSPLHSFT